MPVRVRPYVRRRRQSRRILQPHLKRVADWEFEDDEANLLDAQGEVVDRLYLDGLVDEWLLEAGKRKWVDYDTDAATYEYDGNEVTIYVRGRKVDTLYLDSLIEEWLREQGSRAR